jgi:hypothetical protein
MSEDGGPAFPRTAQMTGSGWVTSEGSGMSLRDYFAAKAMAALITNSEWDDRLTNEGGVAQIAYVIADAMLKQRAK